MGGSKNGSEKKKISGCWSASGDSSSSWLAPNLSKRWGERFFLFYTPFWLTLCLGIVVPYKLYENFTELEYLLLGLVSAVPSFAIPVLAVGKIDSSMIWKDRYWVKASVWIIIFSYVGNYFWTHYFFTVLGASYTFLSWRINNVPHTTFLLTHACFLFYHVISNMTLRRLRHSVSDLPEKVQWVIEAAWILALSYFIAWLETIAISNFPYYQFVDQESMYKVGSFSSELRLNEFSYIVIGQIVIFILIIQRDYFISNTYTFRFPYYQFVDRASMYKVGSLFYAIYFLVSFPMFLRIDEKPGDKWDLPRVAVDALGAAMLVTIILDLWRIFLGPIVPVPASKQCLEPGLPWFPGHALG